MRIKVLMYCICWLVGALSVDAVAQNPTTDFSKANAAYRAGRYDEAAKGYESILQQGWESGPIYYNLANTFYKKHDLGRAILNYERAYRFIPRDADLNANYRFALTEIPNRIDLQKNFIENLWFQHERFYTLNEMVCILLVLLILLVVVHLFSLNRKWRQGRYVIAIILVLIGVFIYGLKCKVDDVQNAGIAIQSASARFEPDEKGTIYFDLSQGQRVNIRKRENGWLKIERPDGKIGWVPETEVEKI